METWEGIFQSGKITQNTKLQTNVTYYYYLVIFKWTIYHLLWIKFSVEKIYIKSNSFKNEKKNTRKVEGFFQFRKVGTMQKWENLVVQIQLCLVRIFCIDCFVGLIPNPMKKVIRTVHQRNGRTRADYRIWLGKLYWWRPKTGKELTGFPHWLLAQMQVIWSWNIVTIYSSNHLRTASCKYFMNLINIVSGI